MKWYQRKQSCEFLNINPIVKPQSLKSQQETPQSSGKDITAQPSTEAKEAPKGLKNLKAKRKASRRKILINQTQAKLKVTQPRIDLSTKNLRLNNEETSICKISLLIH